MASDHKGGPHDLSLMAAKRWGEAVVAHIVSVLPQQRTKTALPYWPDRNGSLRFHSGAPLLSVIIEKLEIANGFGISETSSLRLPCPQHLVRCSSAQSSPVHVP